MQAIKIKYTPGRPQTKAEIENDLKQFLQIISPVIEATKGSSNTFLIITKLLKKINDPDFVNIKALGPLLEKYNYLLEE